MEKTSKLLIDEIRVLARSEKTTHFQKCIERIKQDCKTTHEVKYEGYGNQYLVCDDYTMSYAVATITAAQLEAEGFKVEKQAINPTQQHNDKNCRYRLIVSGWLD